MSLFALFFEALAGTVTILSAPKLLDRVLMHLCRWPVPDMCIALMLLARMLPLGAGIA